MYHKQINYQYLRRLVKIAAVLECTVQKWEMGKGSSTQIRVRLLSCH